MSRMRLLLLKVALYAKAYPSIKETEPTTAPRSPHSRLSNAISTICLARVVLMSYSWTIRLVVDTIAKTGYHNNFETQK
jgi:hypothetical protein